MKIEKLLWDSEFFGINIGRLIVQNDKDFDALRFIQQADDEKYELIYVFKFQNMLPWDKVLNAKLELVDLQITMSKAFHREDFINFPYEIKNELSDKEKDECYKIAEETSIVSRFYTEKKIGAPKAKELYRKWIDNSLNKSFSDGLFIIKDCNEIVGIHLIKTDKKENVGYCSVIGVNPNKKRIQIGRKLWEQSFGYWANESKIEICKVPFSILNLESFNFHLKMGFNKTEEIKYIYHYRNNTR